MDRPEPPGRQDQELRGTGLPGPCARVSFTGTRALDAMSLPRGGASVIARTAYGSATSMRAGIRAARSPLARPAWPPVRRRQRWSAENCAPSAAIPAARSRNVPCETYKAVVEWTMPPSSLHQSSSRSGHARHHEVGYARIIPLMTMAAARRIGTRSSKWNRFDARQYSPGAILSGRRNWSAASRRHLGALNTPLFGDQKSLC